MVDHEGYQSVGEDVRDLLGEEVDQVVHLLVVHGDHL